MQCRPTAAHSRPSVFKSLFYGGARSGGVARRIPTQPFPLAPPPLVPQRLSADDAGSRSGPGRRPDPEKSVPRRSEGVFTPPSVQGTVAFPGNLGGMNWSSGALRIFLFIVLLGWMSEEVLGFEPLSLRRKFCFEEAHRSFHTARVIFDRRA